MTDSVITRIDMIRHGEPVGGRKYRGQIDDPLSDKGWQQMRDAVADHHPWDVVVSSSLSRCRAFAEEITTRHNLPLLIDPRFMEIGFGDWEGKTAAELMQIDKDLLVNFWRSPLQHTPQGAETLHEFEQRIISGWDDLLQQQQGKHILLVGHAGQQRMVIRHVLDMPLDKMYKLQIKNAGITRIDVEHYNDDDSNTSFSKLVFMNGAL